jgi:hypothetical protein
VIVVFNADRCSGSRAKTTGKTCSFGDIGRLALLTKETALLSRRQFRCCDAINKNMSGAPALAQFGAMQHDVERDRTPDPILPRKPGEDSSTIVRVTGEE